MRAVDHIEMHVAHSCNLSCESCSHYSNHHHKGVVALADAERWMQAWQSRINPRKFTLLGGEPTIHPDLTGFLQLARRTWPETQLRIITNGWFLHRHPGLPEALAADPDASILISVHHDSPEYRAKLDPIFELAGRWVRDYRISIEVERSYQRWTRRYKGKGSAMEPYDDGDPALSWKNCVAKYTPQLHEGKLWKCAPLAYLGLQDGKVGLSPKWTHYLGYRPLSPECTDGELAEFLGRREESHCNMCPARPERFELPVPFSPVAPGPAHKSAKPAAAPKVPGARKLEPLHNTIHPLSATLAANRRAAFKSFSILEGRTPNVPYFESHASVLAPGRSPHPPHVHNEEELLIVLDGQAELVLRQPGETPEESRVRMRPGAFAYYPAFSQHTIYNAGKSPLTYLMFKWRSENERRDGTLRRLMARFPTVGPKPGKVRPRAYLTRKILNGKTAYLDKLHCHISLMQPGGGYAAHIDEHDVAIVTLQGVVETLGRRVEPCSVIYYPAGEEHGMRNPGKQSALYLVFEFHGRAAGPT